MIRFALILLNFLIFGLACLFAQTNGNQLLLEIAQAYNQLNYTEAEVKARAALRNYESFTPTELTEVHKILGLIYYSQNKPLEARQQFESALSVTPELQLDALFVSPKILEFFNQIKDDLQRQKNQIDVSSNPVRYVLVQDPRPSAALRSMVLPGWGQLYKGERRKGVILTTLWGVGIVGAVTAHLARNSAEDKYLSETDPEQIDSRYSTFSTFHKVRNNLLIFSAGIWLFSYIDAILKPGSDTFQSKEFSVSPAISTKQAHVTISLHF